MSRSPASIGAARRETLSIGAKVALLAFCILTVTLILYFYALALLRFDRAGLWC